MLRLIPVASVDPAIREQFEEHAKALAAVDHVNVARVFAFERENDHFVFLSEFFQGQTVESWGMNAWSDAIRCSFAGGASGGRRVKRRQFSSAHASSHSTLESDDCSGTGYRGRLAIREADKFQRGRLDFRFGRRGQSFGFAAICQP